MPIFTINNEINYVPIWIILIRIVINLYMSNMFWYSDLIMKVKFNKKQTLIYLLILQVHKLN